VELSDNMIIHIRAEAKRMHYGRVIIEVNETRKTVDVITEHRERFERDPAMIDNHNGG